MTNRTSRSADGHLTRKVVRLIDELALAHSDELELHYEDGDFRALGPSLDLLERARDLLASLGHRHHPDIDVVLSKGWQARN